MEPIYVMIDAAETGNHIRRLMDERGLSIRDVQEACGFVAPQSVYNWLSGKKLPRLDNMIILAKLLDTPIDNILVTNEDVFLCCFEPTACLIGRGHV